MASRFSLARTIDIRVNQFPSGTNKFEIFNGLYDYFENQAYHKVVSIQECPGRMARVTFEAGGEASKDFFEERGVVAVNGVECQVIKPPPPATTVIVYWYPFEAPDSAVNTALAEFGSVIEVKNQCWSARPAVSTGSKLVRMVIQKEIPRFIIINPLTSAPLKIVPPGTMTSNVVMDTKNACGRSKTLLQSLLCFGQS